MDEQFVTNAPRARLLADVPVSQRQLPLAGIATAVLEGGEGPPLVLLHGPGEHAARWLRVIPELVRTRRVIAPDLPAHGDTAAIEASADIDRVLGWLDALIDRTCDEPPALLGHIVGGAIAARYAAVAGERLDRLALVDALGLAPFAPAPQFGAALGEFLARPAPDTHDALWRQCAFDLDRLRAQMGERWERLKAYNLDRAQVAALKPAQQRLMELFGLPQIPPQMLAQIAIPVDLIWGRHDLATPLAVAQASSERFGWPLHVIEASADDPAIEQPQAFVAALREALQR
ncbi:MAG TPA: alpha/beta hydrolase [Burkholderiaceae bacterium]|nr:alpha/beta hydrolase [Burkholderiaceae bacterium]